MNNSTINKIALSSLLLLSFTTVQAYEPEGPGHIALNDEYSLDVSDNIPTTKKVEDDKTEWDIKLGAGAVTIPSPGVGGNSQNFQYPHKANINQVVKR